MSFAPQQDWSAYQALVKNSDRQFVRNLSLEQRFALYEDLFAMVCCHGKSTAGRIRAEQRRWSEKLAFRRKLISAYQSKDQRRRG